MKTKPSWRQKWKIYNDEKNNNNSSNKTTKNDVHWSIRMGPCFLLGSLISRLLSPSLRRLPIFLPLSLSRSLSRHGLSFPCPTVQAPCCRCAVSIAGVARARDSANFRTLRHTGPTNFAGQQLPPISRSMNNPKFREAPWINVDNYAKTQFIKEGSEFLFWRPSASFFLVCWIIFQI